MPTAPTGKLLARLARVDVLPIDDWALSPARESDRHDLLEVIEDRYGQRSTIITTREETSAAA